MNIFFKTSRLILRQLSKDDENNLVTLDSDPEVMRFINGGIASSYEAISNDFLPYAMSLYDKDKNLGFWAIIEKSSNEFIGWVFLRPESDFKLLQQLELAESDAIELGYRLRKQSWGKNYATEVAQALVNRSFTESNIKKIVAWAIAKNKASTRVMEKAGLELQHEYCITADIVPDKSLLENLLIRNLLNRQIVKYQISKAIYQ